MGEICLITGASGEIGQAIAIRLASDGYRLVLHYNQTKEVIDQLKLRLPKEAILDIIQADLTNEDGIHSLLDNVYYSIDHIVFSSGRSEYGLFQDMSEVTMEEMLCLHVKSTWLISKKFIPSMIRKQSGSITVISSIWGEVGAACEVIYSSVKGAQNSFVKALAKEVASSGVSVNGVSPGFIDTKMNQNLSEEEKKDIIEQIPMNRAGRPEEIAHLVSFLIDAKSSYIQGEIINVTGAW